MKALKKKIQPNVCLQETLFYKYFKASIEKSLRTLTACNLELLANNKSQFYYETSLRSNFMKAYKMC